MNRFLNILKVVLVWLGCCTIATAQSTSIDLVLDDVPLKSAIQQLEKEYHFFFSYQEKDVEGIQVSIRAKSATIEAVMQQLLKGQALQYEITGGNYIILSTPATISDRLSESHAEPPPAELVVCGNIIDSFTQKQLPFASIYLKNVPKGGYAKEDGSFRLNMAADPTDTLVLSYVGYKEKQFEVRDFTGNRCPTIALNYLDLGDDFIVVTDYLTDGVDLGQQSATTIIRPQRMPVLPGLAEADVLSSIQFLPGIASPKGAASDIYIRGGTPDQNLVIWENIPIYHSAHYFGMISAFNPYIIDKVNVYRGGFSADYGGRISGVIEMESPGRQLESSSFGAGANFLQAYTHGQISLFDQKASVVYSLRRSLSELWRSPAFENITSRNQQNLQLLGSVNLSALPPSIKVDEEFNFLDSHVKVDFQLSPLDEIAIAGFYGDNYFDNLVRDNRKRQDQKDILDLQNHGLSVSWNRKWNKKLQSKLVGINTAYNYDYSYEILSTDGNAFNQSGIKTNDIQEQQIHFSTTYTTPNNHQLKAGYQWINYNLEYEIVQEREETTTDDKRDNFDSKLQTAYFDFSLDAEKKLGGAVGLRLSHYGKNNQWYAEPRLSVWYRLSEALSLNANVGRYYQFVSQLVEFRGDDVGILTPIWVMAGDKGVPVLGSTQLQLGMVYNKHGWVIDLQAYAKDIDGLTSLATGFTLRPKGFDLGRSTIRGLDVLVKKRWGNFRSWVSYSLSKTEYQFETFFDTEFAAPYDQRHVLNWVNLYKVGAFEFSLGWRIASGTPYARMDRFEIVQNDMGRDVARPIYRAYNSENLPLFHQLDCSIQYHLRPQQIKKWRGVIGLSLFNIYHNKNIYDREYYVNLRKDVPPMIAIIDRENLGFTPNMVIRFEW